MIIRLAVARRAVVPGHAHGADAAVALEFQAVPGWWLPGFGVGVVGCAPPSRPCGLESLQTARKTAFLIFFFRQARTKNTRQDPISTFPAGTESQKQVL